MEIWHYIIEATVELVVKYDCASDRPPRSTVLKRKDGLSFSFRVHGKGYRTPLSNEADEARLLVSIMDRSGKHDWDVKVLDSRTSFRGMVAHVKNSIEIESQRSCGIRSIEFLGVIHDLLRGGADVNSRDN